MAFLFVFFEKRKRGLPNIKVFYIRKPTAFMTPSSRGPGHRPFTAVTGVRLPLGSPNKPPSGGFLLAQSVVMIRYKYFYRVILIFGFGLVQVGLYRF